MSRYPLPSLAVLSLTALLTGCAHPAPTYTSAPKDVVHEKQKAASAPLVTVEVPSAGTQDDLQHQQRFASEVPPTDLRTRLTQGQNGHEVRKFPYPYRAMLAIASDIDDTTPAEFEEYHRFLNTNEETPYGQGLGLDVADSFWMYMGNNQPNITDQAGHKLEGVMTYFDFTNPKKKRDADLILRYWQAGWIDSMHTFGDFSRKNHSDISFNRDLAIAAWNEMNRVGIHPQVWINHGNEANVDAFGDYNAWDFSKYQAGDNPKSPYYHTDLTIKNGVHFVWNSVGEATFGQADPLFNIHLRDGQNVWGFHRYTNEPVQKNGKRDWTWVPREIQKQITPERLDELVNKQQYAIIGQHLGGYNIGFPFDAKGLDTLHLLSNYQDDGNILIARTSRLLNYDLAQKYVHYATATKAGDTWLNITAIDDPIFGPQPLTTDAVRGLTFYVNDPTHTHLLLNMLPLPWSDYQTNAPDETGKPSISIKWFAPDYTDYTGKENPDLLP